MMIRYLWHHYNSGGYLDITLWFIDIGFTSQVVLQFYSREWSFMCSEKHELWKTGMV